MGQTYLFCVVVLLLGTTTLVGLLKAGGPVDLGAGGAGGAAGVDF